MNFKFKHSRYPFSDCISNMQSKGDFVEKTSWLTSGWSIAASALTSNLCDMSSLARYFSTYHLSEKTLLYKTWKFCCIQYDIGLLIDYMGSIQLF